VDTYITALVTQAVVTADSAPAAELVTLRDIVLMGLTAVGGLLFWLIKSSVKTANSGVIDKIEHLTKDLEECRSKVDTITGNWNDLKDNLVNRYADKFDSLREQISKAEDTVNRLHIKLVQESVPKDEFRSVVLELKGELRGLKDEIASVDQITREQGLLLTKMDGALESLLKVMEVRDERKS
jgi:chromosome segregation ATPase